MKLCMDSVVWRMEEALADDGNRFVRRFGCNGGYEGKGLVSRLLPEVFKDH